MMVLITYDVNTSTDEGKKRLRKVARICQNYGQRVQLSVFECIIDMAQLKTLQAKLEKVIDKNTDSLRYYYLGSEWRGRVEHIGAKRRCSLGFERCSVGRVEHIGAKPSLDLEGLLIT